MYASPFRLRTTGNVLRRSVWCAVALLAAGCAPLAPAGPSETAPKGGPEARKAITVVALNPIRAFGAWETGSTGGTFALHQIHADVLVTTDVQGAREPRLLSKLPSIEDGTLVVLPDGRMQTTWKLRPNIKWHDGVPLSPDDLEFTRQVHTDPESGLRPSAQVANMERIDVVDPLTAVVTWKTTFYQATLLGLRQFWTLPRHLLADALRADKETFRNHPYWTSAYVGLGPFRLVDYGLGENLVFGRFDDYFLGRPRLDTIYFRVIPEENAVFAGLQAGAIDLVPEGALSPDLVSGLRDEWIRSGAGTVVDRAGTWRFLGVQFHPEWGSPPELSRDARVRQGLFMGFDRHALRETLLPGFATTDPDSFMDRNDPRGQVIGRPFARYHYDPQRAAQLLADSGWRRGPDGRLVRSNREAVQVSMRSVPGYYKEASIAAQYWRDLGIDVVEDAIPPPLVRDTEYRARFSGLETAAHASGDRIFPRFDSRNFPAPQNRYTGNNAGSYANARLDHLIDSLYGTVEERQQGLLLKEMGEILAEELPVLPTYFQVSLAAVRRGVHALVDDFAGAPEPGLTSRNAYRWDRE